jgi:hypothetical protein
MMHLTRIGSDLGRLPVRLSAISARQGGVRIPGQALQGTEVEDVPETKSRRHPDRCLEKARMMRHPVEKP